METSEPAIARWRSNWAVFVYAVLVPILAWIISSFSTANFVYTVTSVFVISLLGFHLLAWISFERTTLWRFLDYLFDIVTIFSIIAIVSGLHVSNEQKKIQLVELEWQGETQKIIYVVQSILTNDCTVLPNPKKYWSPAPEPTPGECARLAHFLPQMQYQFGTSPKEQLNNNAALWGLNLRYDGMTLTGSWSGLQAQANKLIKIQDNLNHMSERRRLLDDSLASGLAETVQYVRWQYLLAFILALKIAQRTAKILAEQSKRKNAEGQKVS